MIPAPPRCKECGFEPYYGHDIGCTMAALPSRSPQDRRNPPGEVRIARGASSPLWRLLGMRWRWQASSPHGVLMGDAEGWAWSRRAAIRKARRILAERAEPDWETP